MVKRATGYHLIYGEHAVQSVLEHGMRDVMEIYVLPDKLYLLSAAIRHRYADRIQVVERKFLDRFTRCEHKHQGFAIKTGDLIDRGNLIDAIAQISDIRERIYGIALDRVQDPHNVGAIIRSAACFDIDFIAMCKHDAPPINNTIVRTSVGCSERMPLYTFTNLNHLIRYLRPYDFCIMGLDADSDSVVVPKDIANNFKRALFILGSEGCGLNRSLRNSCDAIMRIPMNKGLDSLNVSNAAAIIAYETFISRECK